MRGLSTLHRSRHRHDPALMDPGLSTDQSTQRPRDQLASFLVLLLTAGCGERQSAPPKSVPTNGAVISISQPAERSNPLEAGAEFEIEGRAEVPDSEVKLQAVRVKLFQGNRQVGAIAGYPQKTGNGQYSFQFKLKAPKAAGKCSLMAEGDLGWADGRPALDPAQSKIKSQSLPIEVK